MSDLIDKQVVLDTIHLFFTEEIDKIPTKKTEDGEVLIMCKAQPLFAMNKTLCKRIKALPSASPTQNCVGSAIDMRCDDAISRQAVFEQINCWIGSGEYRYTNATDYLNKRIKALQVVNPQEPNMTWITGSDGAKIAFKDVPAWKVTKICQILADVVEAEEDQEPTGHWEWLTEDKYRCSNCNSETRVDECMNVPMYEFCPFCGAKMAESEEV